MFSTSIIILFVFIFVFVVLIGSWAIVELLQLNAHKHNSLQRKLANGLIYLYLIFFISTSVIGIVITGILFVFM